ncbi:hypothetical protein BL250_14585 [Erwinia sp. OLTSP20]|uniref:enterobactin synthase subunit EntD n=1 Tax=unclassified Erwinia TaxID=2622719 RepID=UPI000C18D90A|nr:MULTISPECIES: enterobactin synthase subunit EntD [unclassified Erwinia]PIJ50200.1 hypothetical protein BV501_08950 [Erwinia sp. OAMSP11]PIJ72037.1 hypothetical protein BK416_09850 [Erwinia sp. OLSSP12]PIJ81328.1 hypothetical protein BLD47_08675 [Erwinia sp. OLCASP19]PIJ84034.1 hypothetical protein BLD46_08255 [Erwinia sp. OLMTSP26]PIJ85733.1 hypothetical protein BLD49_09475 [Erwinia sp. OLMDSP33]
MQVHHTTFSLAGLTLQRVDFDPLTFSAQDLLWLPHHRQLQGAVKKRQAEHLAGRLAAAHALRAFGCHPIPAIGNQQQPLWPAGLFGSISHCETTALALVARHPVGVDIERIMTRTLCAEIATCLINDDEQQILHASAFPLTLALTVAFCAKESLFKAFSSRALPLTDFAASRILRLDADSVQLRLYPTQYPQLSERRCTVHWQHNGDHIVALCADQ